MGSVRLGESSSLRILSQILAAFGFFCALIASLGVLANDVYYFLNFGFTPSVALILLGLIAGFLPGTWALSLVISLLPLTVGMPNLLNSLLGVHLLAMPNPGLDLVAGFFIAHCIKALQYRLTSNTRFSNWQQSLRLNNLWPIGLVLLMITASVVLAIARNLYMSATSTSLRAFVFNLMHFRPMDWRADFLPIGNWVAYAIAAALIYLVIANLSLQDAEKKNTFVFRSLMIGLVISAIAGLTQAATGWGLPEAQLQFRRDAFGFAAIGLQPDLHAFAAHMLLGVVGLWGYFFNCKSKLERLFILLTFVLCSAGLIASKSRASLVIAVIALVIFGLIYIYRQSRKSFFASLTILVVVICIILMGAGSIPGLSWVGELIAQMQSRRLDSLSDLGGMMGSRFEIWSAVANMFSSYPLMGVGEGEFYRLSSNISFAKSEFLKLNHGENAHNYFLQVLAENGLIGIIIFAIAFIVPYRSLRNKQMLLPASIGLLSLFLGNIFAHSFLVRENLLLGAALLGLMFSISNQNRVEPTQIGRITKQGNLWLYVPILGLLIGGAIEVINSFERLPFKKGIDCYVKELPTSKDEWTSGAWELRFAPNVRGLDISLTPNRTGDLQKHPLVARFEILSWEPGKGKVPILEMTHSWTSNEVSTIHIALPVQYVNSSNVVTVRIQTSSCYTPRNLGVNTDARRLGLHIESVRFW